MNTSRRRWKIERGAGPGPRTGRIGWSAFLTVAVLAGCGTLPEPDSVVGPSYRPSNVFVLEGGLPLDLKRVAVLPPTPGRPDADLEAGCASLGAVLLSELAKARRFEVQPVTSAQLQQWSGRASWAAEDTLPAGLLGRIEQELGCQAILFSRLTEYRAYPPLAVGWNLKLVQAEPARILWAFDEVFDAGEGTVVNGARRYYQQHVQTPQPLRESRSILASPRRFGQYTLDAALATLPRR